MTPINAFDQSQSSSVLAAEAENDLAAAEVETGPKTRIKMAREAASPTGPLDEGQKSRHRPSLVINFILSTDHHVI